MLKKMKTYFPCFLTVMLVVFYIGCATTQQSAREDTPVGDVADIDRLLGLTEEEENKEETIDEDEVMKLLGVVEDKDEISKPGDTTGGASSGEGKELAFSEDSLGVSVPRLEENSSTSIFEQDKSTIGTSERESVKWKTISYAGRYKEALDSYKNRNYNIAIQKFEALLTLDKNNTLSDNCQYWIGESYYGLGNYRQAIDAFRKVFLFAKSNKNDDAQVKLGLCYMRLNDKDNAKIEFQKLIDEYPTSEFNSIARQFLEKLD